MPTPQRGCGRSRLDCPAPRPCQVVERPQALPIPSSHARQREEQGRTRHPYLPHPCPQPPLLHPAPECVRVLLGAIEHDDIILLEGGPTLERARQTESMTRGQLPFCPLSPATAPGAVGRFLWSHLHLWLSQLRSLPSLAIYCGLSPKPITLGSAPSLGRVSRQKRQSFDPQILRSAL